MRIRVVAVGRSGEEAQRQVDIAPTDTVGELYQRVAEALDRSPADFSLSYKEKSLTDKNQKIASLGMKEGDTVYASVMAEGGGGLREILKKAMGSLSSQIFYFYEVNSVGNSHFNRPLPKSEANWLAREYANMLRHQPAAKAIDLRNYYFEYRARSGPFTGRIFCLYIRVNSPYEPPVIYCQNPHGHPNFYPDGRLCIATPWQPFGSLFEYLERVKYVINNPCYHSPAR
ncbi:MAG: hypothetical protein DRJ38_03435 [Thermoprotei archaeon]|nr:MAG: hypothetical protein DRJ38_03435 [Thermoprotei archaeon]